MLYLILVIVFLLILFCIPVHVVVDWNEKLIVRVRYLFFKFTVFPFKKKENKKDSSEVKEKKTDNNDKKNKKEKKKKSVEEVIDELVDITKRYGPGARVLLKSFRIHEISGFWKITDDDASECAIKYGRICALISSSMAFLRNLIKIEKEKFRIYPDFSSDEDIVNGYIDFQFVPLIALVGTIMLLVTYLKFKLSE